MSSINITFYDQAASLHNFTLRPGSQNGLRWSWKVSSGLVLNNCTGKLDDYVFLSWKFEWDDTQKSFEGDISANVVHWERNGPEQETTVEFPVELLRSGEWIHKKLTPSFSFIQAFFDCSLKLETTKGLSKLESMFGESESNDVVLIVEGSKRLHVNKAVLSYHSEYFRSLFFSEFQEKSMQEIEIKDVKLEYFAGLLSLISNKPVMPNANTLLPILELADRFLIPSIFEILQFFVFRIENIKFETVFLMAYTYKLEELRKKCLSMMTCQEEFRNFGKTQEFDELEESVKVELLQRGLRMPKRKV